MSKDGKQISFPSFYIDKRILTAYNQGREYHVVIQKGDEEMAKPTQQVINESKKKLYDRIEIYVRKDLQIKEQIENHCQEYGYLNEDGIYKEKKTNRAKFILKAIETQMAIDRGELKLTKPRKKKEEK